MEGDDLLRYRRPINSGPWRWRARQGKNKSWRGWLSKNALARHLRALACCASWRGAPDCFRATGGARDSPPRALRTAQSAAAALRQSLRCSRRLSAWGSFSAAGETAIKSSSNILLRGDENIFGRARSETLTSAFSRDTCVAASRRMRHPLRAASAAPA